MTDDDDRELTKDEFEDLVLRHLRQQNTLAAIAFGMQVADAVMHEVLHDGAAVLGPKKKIDTP